MRTKFTTRDGLQVHNSTMVMIIGPSASRGHTDCEKKVRKREANVIFIINIGRSRFRGFLGGFAHGL